MRRMYKYGETEKYLQEAVSFATGFIAFQYFN